MYNKNTLVEIKKGEEGKGLLIENDGYVSLDVKGNEKLNESVRLNEGESVAKNLPRPFIVSAVFQKFGIENANGRVYPEGILKREVEKYQQAIKERRAYGECYTPDAECLTEKGWVSIVEVKEGDKVVTWNTETNKNEIQEVTYKSELDWNGDMINIRGSFIDDVVTPTHQFPVYKIKKGCFENKDNDTKFYGFVSAFDIMERFANLDFDASTSYFIPCSETPNLTKYGDNDRNYLWKNEISAETVEYKGKVYCIEVPNHTWYVRQNGHSHWTKNCNHPETSSIDLSRIAMNIVELHWEGHTLVGKMEIPITDGFRNLGIVSTCADQVAQWILNGLKVGVSSRALGSVTQVMDKLVVGDDLELVCWDCVSQPSTPNAWIETNPENLRPYLESKDEGNKPLIKEDKFSKFDSWLND